MLELYLRSFFTVVDAMLKSRLKSLLVSKGLTLPRIQRYYAIRLRTRDSMMGVVKLCCPRFSLFHVLQSNLEVRPGLQVLEEMMMSLGQQHCALLKVYSYTREYN